MNEAELKARLDALLAEHRALDGEIRALVAARGDALRIARLKKRKLQLKDQMATVGNMLLPDIIA